MLTFPNSGCAVNHVRGNTFIYFNHTCGSMKQYKNIRLSKSVFADLIALQKEDESIPDTIKRLTGHYWDKSINYCLVNDDFCKEGDGDPEEWISYIVHVRGGNVNYSHQFEYNKEELTEVMRLPRNALEGMNLLRGHPDESYNTTVFRLICMNKALEEWEKKCL